jgi:hypothetical protein
MSSGGARNSTSSRVYLGEVDRAAAAAKPPRVGVVGAGGLVGGAVGAETDVHADGVDLHREHADGVDAGVHAEEAGRAVWLAT